jgi:formate dehydrogenase gamma subunit
MVQVPIESPPDGTGPSRPAAPALSDALWVPVLSILEETHDVRTFRLARPMGFDFQAGQSLRVDVPVGTEHLTCRCSISSAPETTAWFEVTVKQGDRASRALYETAGAGSLLSVHPPEGSFVYPAGDRRPILLLGGGSGCIPLVSMLRHAVASDPSREVILLLSVRTVRDVPFRRELHTLAKSRNVRVGICLSRESHRLGFLAGHIDEDLLLRAARDLSQWLVFVSGPVPMVEQTKELLRELGTPDEQVRSETFEGEVRAVAGAAETGVSLFPAAVPAPIDLDATRPVRTPIREEEILPALDAILRPWTPPVEAVPQAKGDRSAFPGSPPESKMVPGEDGPGESTRSGRIVRFPNRSKTILRFRRGERMLHWAIAIPFMTCFATGMVLKFLYDLHPEGHSRDVLAFIHRVSGASLALFPALAVLRNWRDFDAFLENVKVGWFWTFDDVKWLVFMVPAALSDRFTLPDQRKFNAAERMNFMAVMVTYPIFVVTGLILWMPGIHFVPWVVHFGAAVLTAPLMFGHIHMALINPRTRVGLSGMFSGYVDREWASHHYSRWYRENFEEQKGSKP